VSDVGAHLIAAAVQDAQSVATLLRRAGGDRSWRRRGRAVLARAFALAESDVDEPPLDGDPGPQPPSTPEIAAVLVELEEVRRGLGDLAARRVRRLRDVRIQSPFPHARAAGRSAALASALCADIVDRSTLELTISEQRLAWFEARCEAADPGLLRPIRASRGDGGGHRLLGSELELIRKRGPGRSS